MWVSGALWSLQYGLFVLHTPSARVAKPRSTLPRRLTASVPLRGKPRASSTRTPSGPYPSARDFSRRRRQGQPLRNSPRLPRSDLLPRSLSAPASRVFVIPVLPVADLVRIHVCRIDSNKAVGTHTQWSQYYYGRRTHIARHASSVMMPHIPA